MKNPGSLMFVLRWYWLQFFSGLAFVSLGVYGLLNSTDSPANAAYSSVSQAYGKPIFGLAVLQGMGLLAYSWAKASSMRNGSGGSDGAGIGLILAMLVAAGVGAAAGLRVVGVI